MTNLKSGLSFYTSRGLRLSVHWLLRSPLSNAFHSRVVRGLVSLVQHQPRHNSFLCGVPSFLSIIWGVDLLPTPAIISHSFQTSPLWGCPSPFGQPFFLKQWVLTGYLWLRAIICWANSE